VTRVRGDRQWIFGAVADFRAVAAVFGILNALALLPIVVAVGQLKVEPSSIRSSSSDGSSAFFFES